MNDTDAPDDPQYTYWAANIDRDDGGPGGFTMLIQTPTEGQAREAVDYRVADAQQYAEDYRVTSPGPVPMAEWPSCVSCPVQETCFGSKWEGVSWWDAPMEDSGIEGHTHVHSCPGCFVELRWLRERCRRAEEAPSELPASHRERLPDVQWDSGLREGPSR